MPTLKDLLEGDLGASGSTKTASAQPQQEPDGIDKLAMQLGLFGDVTETEEKVASDDEEKEEEKKEDEKKDEGKGENPFAKKEASAAGAMGDLYSTIFGEDDLGETKTAEEVKTAAYQEALGGRAYDHFAVRFDKRIEKIASDMASGASQDARVFPQTLPTNKGQRDGGGQKIDTTPQVQDQEMKVENSPAVVGKEEHKTAMAAAIRKHTLLSPLED